MRSASLLAADAARRRRAPSSREGEAGGPALHGRGGEPHRPVRLQARADQAARPASPTSASPSRRSRTAWAPGSSRSSSSGPTARAARCSARSWPTWATVVDDIAFVHNMVGKTGVHSQGTLLQATGFNRPGFPAMGCWVSYGLGRLNENLPTFVVLPDHRGFASNGTEELGLGLPPRPAPGDRHLPRRRRARSPTCSPTRRLRHPRGRRRRPRAAGPPEPRARRRPPGDARLEARIRSYELAARMQLAAPEALDISGEPADVLRLYGLDHGKSSFDQRDQPARGDRRLRPQVPGRPPAARAGRPVRPGLVAATTTASPAGTGTRTRTSSATTARSPWGWPGAPSALIKDLKQRGHARRHDRPLDHRVRPDALARGARAATTTPTVFTNWLAGGGIKGGISHGPSDEFGYKPLDRDHPTAGLRHPRHHPAPARHRPHQAHRPPRRHRPPADRRPRPCDQGDPGLSRRPGLARVPLGPVRARPSGKDAASKSASTKTFASSPTPPHAVGDRHGGRRRSGGFTFRNPWFHGNFGVVDEGVVYRVPSRSAGWQA